jgi:hypothetical protein|eukprot:CAMPEP_0174292674 /NCGR_PEP_ID=MMETSP0809-20121228/36209_1 /TAXON_ID=73025 ORGANISM="Eutreptiella gymnastica-like, Strain CCMP1594" /NCGR_SAMPLE_ID=MMETSP0809 /ASSEMBLY_ACC=CAM_ASM_000658 /LENGTH=243 /DNA_ID=CAMNT_0015392903 /DNA_START=29 /DNA_END=760 /DNA_ORIENTATION=-
MQAAVVDQAPSFAVQSVRSDRKGERLESFAFGALSAVCATILTHPVDTLVVHRQTGKPRPTNLRGMYRGGAMACLQNGLTFGILFGSYDFFRAPSEHGGLGMALVPGAAMAAFPETIARGPLEAVKNMVQLQQRINLRRVAKASGVMLCREVPGNIAYFTTYEMARAHGAGALVSGALAGVTFAFLTFPIDTIRTQVAAGQRPRPSYRGVSGFALRIGGYGALMFAFNEFLWERVAGHVWEDK